MAVGSKNGISEARAFGEGVNARLDRLIDLSAAQLEEKRYRYEQLILNTGSASAVSGALSPPPGRIWLIQQIAATGAAAGFLCLYLDEIAASRLLVRLVFQAITGAPFPAATTTTVGDDGLVIIENNDLIVHFTNEGASQVCTAHFGIVELVLGKSRKVSHT